MSTLFLAMFLARLLDPLAGLIAVMAGARIKSPWSILVGGFAGVIAQETFLFLTREHRFNLDLFLSGFLAMSTWAAIAWYIRRRRGAGKMQNMVAPESNLQARPLHRSRCIVPAEKRGS